MIDANNFKDVLIEYATSKYGDKFAEFHDKFYDEFPYKMEGLDKKLYFKNFMDWLIFEKKLPPMGKTIVEEYIAEHPDMDENTKQKLKGTKEFIASEFIVISKKVLSLKVKDRKTGKLYNSIFQVNIPGIGINSLLIGRIHPFGGTYLFAGAFGVHNSPMILDPDIMMTAYEEKMIRDTEKLILSRYSKLTAILNKYPSQWVDGICGELSLDTKGRKNIKAQVIAEKLKRDMPVIFASLPEKSKEVLKILLNNGGYVNYGKLKDFEDDISFFWIDNPPTSTIGILRIKGLLAVGKMPLNGRMYEVALIPEDIREEIKKIM
ncbi:hypothetical protein HY772_05270 [Candidatus Woesearchaeota archaeon]|nr:hypothetical protein [Candidatus Woesearchaeota archaeon]